MEGESRALTALEREERRPIPLTAGAYLGAAAAQVLIRLLTSAPSAPQRQSRVTALALMSSRRLPQSALVGRASTASLRLQLRVALRLHRSRAAALLASQEEQTWPAMAAGFQEK